MTSMRRKGQGGAGGFSLIELMLVVAIIGITVGIALPVIGNYLRMYAVRAASASVANEIQAARNQAIKRNANYGVAFAILSNNSYRYYGRDATGMQSAPSGLQPAARRNLNDAITDGLAGTLRTLPADFRFRAQGAAGNGICFDRLGMGHLYGTAQCVTDPTVPVVNYLLDVGGLDVQLVIERISNTNITRTIVISSGGRVFQP